MALCLRRLAVTRPGGGSHGTEQQRTSWLTTLQHKPGGPLIQAQLGAYRMALATMLSVSRTLGRPSLAACGAEWGAEKTNKKPNNRMELGQGVPLACVAWWPAGMGTGPLPGGPPTLAVSLNHNSIAPAQHVLQRDAGADQREAARPTKLPEKGKPTSTLTTSCSEMRE